MNNYLGRRKSLIIYYKVCHELTNKRKAIVVCKCITKFMKNILQLMRGTTIEYEKIGKGVYKLYKKEKHEGKSKRLGSRA